MQTDIDPRDLIGHKAVDRNGDKIGTVDEVYLDDATGEPEWAAVRTGIFGRDAFVPLTTSEFAGDELRVPYDKSLIKESPDFGVGQHLSPAQELQLYRYYGLDAGGGTPPPPAATNGSAAAAAAVAADRSKDRDFGKVSSSPQTMTAPEPSATNAAPFAPHAAAPVAAPAPAPAAAPQAAPAEDPPTMQLGSPLAAHQATTQHGAPQSAAPQPSNHHDAQGDTRMPGAAQQPSGPASSAPSGPVEITCREERLDITTEWHVLGTARLRKYVTSEPVERKVPVVRERVRVERVPVTEAERASLTEQEIVEGMEEVTLREERAVVRKYLAPIERVRLVVERYTEEEVIREELRREQVEIHDSTSATNPPVPPPVGPVQRPAESLRPEPLRPS